MNTHVLPISDPCADRVSRSQKPSGVIKTLARFVQKLVQERRLQQEFDILRSDPRMARDWQLMHDRQQWKEPDC